MDTTDNLYKLSQWLLCPIVGEITKRNKFYNIVIICEPIFKDTTIVCHIINNKIYNFEPEELGPTLIVLTVPKSGTYKLIWYQDKNHVYEHEVIVKNQPDQIIFVSCDLLEADQEYSMWTVMNKELSPNKQTCIFHLGDQAYMDGVFNESVKLASVNGINAEVSGQILKAFGNRYCNTWKPHNTILSQTSNYYIWDDHELKNNMALTDSTLSNEEKYVRDLAVISYIKYQESHHLEKNEILSQYSWIKTFDDLLVLAIERNTNEISIPDILTIINTSHQNRIILCFSSAPIPSPQGKYGDLYTKLVNDKGTIETSKFWPQSELVKLYSGLFSWMNGDDTREIIVVGGDLHFGVHGVFRCNKKEIPVIIASPITNQPTTDRWLAANGMSKSYCINISDNNNIVFHTLTSKARRCYAVCNVETSPIQITMNYSKQKLPEDSIKYISTLLKFA